MGDTTGGRIRSSSRGSSRYRSLFTLTEKKEPKKDRERRYLAIDL